jgi:shikimate kinase
VTSGDEPPARVVVLLGMRGVGKTSVGRRAAALLACEFIDIDDVIERQTGLSVADIFRQHGQAEFRAMETRAIEATYAQRSAGLRIVAVGGGAVESPANRTVLSRSAVRIWLTAPTATLAARIAADPLSASRRPSITGGDALVELDELLARRTPHYAALATNTLDASVADVESVARAVAECAGRGGR